MKRTEPRNFKAMKDEAIRNRLNKMIELKEMYLERIANEGYEVVLSEMKLMNPNDKTNFGKTVSFIPIIDCPNCSGCYNLCYDIRNDCIFPGVLNDRARNSALRETNPKRFWKRVGELVKVEFVPFLRVNVGGDLRDEDFPLLNEYVAIPNKKCTILFFTKNYNGINNYLDEHEFATNVKKLMSAWEGMEMDNRHNLPCSHVLFADGRTTAPKFGAFYCGGSCAECEFEEKGCMYLKDGEDVVFLAH